MHGQHQEGPRNFEVTRILRIYLKDIRQGMNQGYMKQVRWPVHNHLYIFFSKTVTARVRCSELGSLQEEVAAINLAADNTRGVVCSVHRAAQSDGKGSTAAVAEATL